MRNWLVNDSAEKSDARSDSDKLVVNESDPKSNVRVSIYTTNRSSAIHTTNGISTQKLLINPIIRVVVEPITLLVTTGLLGARESLIPRQTVLPQENILDAARTCACIYQTPVLTFTRRSSDLIVVLDQTLDFRRGRD